MRQLQESKEELKPYKYIFSFN